MLTHLTVKNFAIVKHLEIDLTSGLTTITGETGAGKSIAIDALGLCLGERADASAVRNGTDKAEISASFDVSQLATARNWLDSHDLNDEDECIIRRIISAEGRSKAYINGIKVGLQQLKELGQFLVSIHGQNAHQRILKSDIQRHMLDNFAQHSSLLDAVSSKYAELKQLERELQTLKASCQQREDRKHLLQYQVQELDEFALAENEFSELETEHKRLSHSQTLLEQAQVSFHQLYEADDFNALTVVQNSLDRIEELQEHDQTLCPIVVLLNEALINIDEASKALREYVEQLEIDPLKMQQVEARYSQAIELARKHHVQPEHLYAHHMQLVEELNSLSSDNERLEALATTLDITLGEYTVQAQALSHARHQAATKLAAQVQTHIQNMNMTEAVFNIEINFDSEHPPQRHGLDTVVFTISTNAGQAADSLDKVVSGGELSRIGLALQVISSSHSGVPTMIFDEVDTGISGPTASVVGSLLRKLGSHTQVFCVTHLPQVAACGHNQMFVTKFSDGNTTETHMVALDENQRVEELARLLAGDKLTDSALANARELLTPK
ncbi:DNA repair protein RecN [Aestuariibacter sp. AA17]|uniref:DNA repair protein RecN n=1 Tax=Fluctibacter corallii TaxID=2984329 RepID=A0ABT3ABG5_9ALTE|nr:DNA repair protein RecN [Aestuariibacter sp. AA17]MCV2885973.1 DNA repair protein RecN [Aestuariibacter sp. AA17]